MKDSRLSARTAKSWRGSRPRNSTKQQPPSRAKDYDNALQELAQCGAVILRMMQYVEETKWAHQGEDKYGT